MPIDPVSLGGKFVAGQLWKKFGPSSGQQKFEEARAKQYAEWVAELQEQVNRLEGEVAAKGAEAAELHERIQAAEAQHRFTAVLLRFTTEGVGSLSDRRRSLLAYAVANSLRPDVHPEALSRILRAIQALEPEDIDLLRKTASLGVTADFRSPKQQRVDLEQVALQFREPPELVLRRAALSSALCLDEHERISSLGLELLSFLDGWERA